MMTVHRFRWLLFLLIWLWVSSILLGLLSSGRPEAGFDPQSHSPLALSVAYGLSFFHLFLFVLVMVGLYRLKRWGRFLALIATIYSILTAGFIDGDGEAGLAAVLYSASSALMVALIAAAYWAPSVSEHFERRVLSE